jgi:hypothetical protein
LKISRYYRKGIAEKADADSGQGENQGKDLNAGLTDTKKTFKKAADLVKNTIHRAKQKVE